MKTGFKVWLETYKDIFGFDEDLTAKMIARLRRPDDKPIRHFNVNEMMNRLAQNKLGHHQGFQKFNNESQWGTLPGAIKVELGMQFTVYIERLVYDLEGDPRWITKKVFKINVNEYNGYEDSVADAIYDEVVKVFMDPLDGPSKEYGGLEDLIETVVDKAKHYGGDMFIFERLKKVNDDNYILVFGVRGGGVGALQKTRSEGRINQYIIDISFDKKTGLLHVIETTVQTGDEGTSWDLQPSFFEGMFCPSQADAEIVESIVTSMKYF